jgi:hypothetical protein
MESTANGSTLVIGLGAMEIALIVAVGYCLSQLAGTKDTSNDIVKTVLPITGTLGGIVLLHTALWYMYSTYKSVDMNVYFLLATSFSIIISLTALSIALVSKS